MIDRWERPESGDAVETSTAVHPHHRRQSASGGKVLNVVNQL